MSGWRRSRGARRGDPIARRSRPDDEQLHLTDARLLAFLAVSELFIAQETMGLQLYHIWLSCSAT